MYPNPTTEKVFFEYQLNEGENGSIEVFTVTGQLIITLPLKPAYNGLAVHTSTFTEGIYIVRVLVNDEKRFSDRLVILR